MQDIRAEDAEMNPCPQEVYARRRRMAWATWCRADRAAASGDTRALARVTRDKQNTGASAFSLVVYFIDPWASGTVLLQLHKSGNFTPQLIVVLLSK